MKKIVIFGAGGQAGSAASVEAASRGHNVTTPARVDADVTDPLAIARVASGQDVAVAAVAPTDHDPVAFFSAAAKGLTVGLRAAGVTRLVWVSIASLLRDASGIAPVDTDDFPSAFRPFSLGHRAALELLASGSMAWTAASPAGDFERAGILIGRYAFTNTGDAHDRVTYTDFARALIDLAERPDEHIGMHVGVRHGATGESAPAGGNAITEGAE